jgi:iron complex outermembrane receptor protein
LEEVIVTATKRDESIQEIPISVTAFSQSDLDIRGHNNLQGIQEVTPNLDFAVQSAGQNAARITLRGVGTETLIGGGDPGVALHIDGVYVGRNIASAADIFDIERIEVLRGPQGTLYGRNANGGSINIVTKRPTDELEGKVDVTLGNYNQRKIRSVINVPLGESLNSRLAMFTDQRDGYLKNLYNGRDSGGNDKSGVRLSLLWESDAGNEVLIKGFHTKVGGTGPASRFLGTDYAETDNGYSDSRVVGVSSGPTPPAGARVVSDPYSLATTAIGESVLPRPTGFYEMRKDAPEFVSTVMEGLDVEVNYNISDNVLLRSITSYQTNNNEILVDADGSELSLETRNRDTNAEQYSQEFNLMSQDDAQLQWILGAYLYNEKISGDFETFFPPGQVPLDTQLPPGAVPGGGGLRALRDMQHETDSYAIFAQLTYGFSDRLSATLGARYTWDEKYNYRSTGGQVDLTNGYLAVGRGAIGPFAPSVGKESWQEPTYRGSVSYNFTDDNLIFASYSHGYKSGGFDFNGGAFEEGGSNIDGGAQIPYDPEFVNAIEIGSKNTFFDNRVRLNITAFTYDYEDLQVFRLTGDGPLTDNAASSSIKGVELESKYAITDNLEIDATYAKLDATYDEYIVERPRLQDFAGRTLNYAPEMSASLGAQYTMPLGQDQLVLRVDISRKGRTYFDRANTENDTREPLNLINARVRYNADNWFVDLFGRNLADKEYLVGQLINPSFSCNCRTVNLGTPRMVGVTFGYEL